MEAREFVSDLSYENLNILWQRIQGITYAAIAEETGLTYQTVSTRFKKLLEEAKRFVGDEHEDDVEIRSKLLMLEMHAAIGEKEQ